MSDDLYREICRDPEDDTLRLAYADWLDENGDPDRAEFIRSRVLGHPPDRANALLAAHPEWSRFPCEACEEWGRVMVDTGVDMPARGKAKGGRLYRPGQCGTCHGTGDLFRAPGVSGASLTPPSRPRAVTFARGFPDAVSCTLAEAFAPDGTPTPWACEVVRRTPVTRFVVTDRTPVWLDSPIALAAGRLVRRRVYGEVRGMTWDDLTAEERMLTDFGNVEAVTPESVGEFMRVWTALFLDETRGVVAARHRADREAAVAVVAELAAGSGV